MKFYNPELGEDVELRENKGFGLCPICGEAIHEPVKYKLIHICKDCYKTRNDEMIEINKNFERLKNEDE